MSDSTNGGNERCPKDARYCPSCGGKLHPQEVRLYGDNTMNRYRATFECGSCGYSGEVIREGGLDDMTLHGEGGLWCGQHDQYEPEGNACDCAFDPDEVPWLVADTEQ